MNIIFVIIFINSLIISNDIQISPQKELQETSPDDVNTEIALQALKNWQQFGRSKALTIIFKAVSRSPDSFALIEQALKEDPSLIHNFYNLVSFASSMESIFAKRRIKNSSQEDKDYHKNLLTILTSIINGNKAIDYIKMAGRKGDSHIINTYARLIYSR